MCVIRGVLTLSCEGRGRVWRWARERRDADECLVITDTELKVIAALARIGLRRRPKKG